MQYAPLDALSALHQVALFFRLERLFFFVGNHQCAPELQAAVLFQFVGVFLLLNMVIAVLLDTFLEGEKMDKNDLVVDVTALGEKWASFDPGHTNYIPVEALLRWFKTVPDYLTSPQHPHPMFQTLL